MNLAADEHIILDEGKSGGGKLVLTNKRLLFMKKDTIADEISLADIAEVYPDTERFTNLTVMKINRHQGSSRTVKIVKSDGLGLLLGGDDFITQSFRSMTERYVSAINRAVDALKPETRKA